MLLLGNDDCADCSSLPSKYCLEHVSMSWSVGHSYSISSTVEATVGVPEVASIKTSLRATMGVSTQVTITIAINCGWIAMPPCQHLKTTPFMMGVTGKTVEMTHVWAASGVWSSAGIWGCGFGTCQIAGNVWQISSCRTETSTLNADPFLSSGCGTNVEFSCGE